MALRGSSLAARRSVPLPAAQPPRTSSSGSALAGGALRTPRAAPQDSRLVCATAAYRPLVSSNAEDGQHDQMAMFDTSMETLNFQRVGTFLSYLETADDMPPSEAERHDKEVEPACLCTIDMGSNSFHLIIVRANRDGQLQAVDHVKERVRLLEGSQGTGRICAEAEERAVQALLRMKKVAESKGAPIRALATSALREAKNRDSILRRIKEEVGLDVEVISGPEEARLIYTGVLQGLPVFDKKVLCIDIGGGSTEFCIGHQGRPLYAKSRPLGHLRLKEDCFKSSTTTPREIWECQRSIRAELAESRIAQEMDAWGGVDCVVGSSGTIERCAIMIAAAKQAAQKDADKDAADTLQPNEILIDDLRVLVHSLIMATTKKQRMALPGMQEKREDVITGGAMLLLEIFHALNITKMRVSPTALREGAVIDSLHRMMPSFQPFTDVRSESVAHLAQRFDLEGRYTSAQHSARLASKLLHGLWATAGDSSVVHELNLADKELLMAGVHLHQVGLFLGHSGNHKHAYYIVKSSELLLGFKPLELEVIALITRFHRKNGPSTKAAELSKLPEAMRNKVLLMIGIARMAIALDRRNTASAVAGVSVSRREDGALQVSLQPSTEPGTGEPVDISLETWAAQQELKFLSRRVGQPVMLFSAALGESWAPSKQPDGKPAGSDPTQ